MTCYVKTGTLHNNNGVHITKRWVTRIDWCPLTYDIHTYDEIPASVDIGSQILSMQFRMLPQNDWDQRSQRRSLIHLFRKGPAVEGARATAENRP